MFVQVDPIWCFWPTGSWGRRNGSTVALVGSPPLLQFLPRVLASMYRIVPCGIQGQQECGFLNMVSKNQAWSCLFKLQMSRLHVCCWKANRRYSINTTQRIPISSLHTQITSILIMIRCLEQHIHSQVNHDKLPQVLLQLSKTFNVFPLGFRHAMSPNHMASSD